MKKDFVLIDLLNKYILDSELPKNNLDLALYYHSIGQTATAVSYYIRTAERTESDLIKYECLLKASICFETQGCRGMSVRGLLQHAISLLPKRPEAYFLLSRFYERTANSNKPEDWFNCYTISSIGLGVCDFDLEPILEIKDYPGMYGILFEKSVSAWWCGLCEESKQISIDLMKNYEMDDAHRNACIKNLTMMNAFYNKDINYYDASKYSRLKHRFKNSEKIERNFSESYQDMFILTMLDGKRNGTYLEIGAGDATYGSNTYLLEKQFGWKGIGIDLNAQFVEQHNKQRTNKCIQQDALTVDYIELLESISCFGTIDYLQLDCDPANVTFEILQKIPFDKFKFGVITYEHDAYCDKTRSLKQRSSEFLSSQGYILVASNVAPDDWKAYEDWWVHPDLVDRKIIDSMRCDDKKVLLIDEYFLASHDTRQIEVKEIKFTKKDKKEYWRKTQWPTLEVTTSIPEKGCVVDCIFCPQRVLKNSYKDEKRIMSLDDFKFMIDKVPQEVRITFSGFTEPWLNRYCTEMVLYAHERGHPVSVFTTGVGMIPEDVERLSTIPYAGNPNGGFCLHLPDQEKFARHPINNNYIKTIEKFKELQPVFKNFYTMCMSENVHESVKHIYPSASVPKFWNRAGNLIGEAKLRPELDAIKERWHSAPESPEQKTCGCYEDLYHNVLLPNGDVSLCCMDYSLEYILGNLMEKDYDDIVPVPNTAYDMCRRCENGVIAP